VSVGFKAASRETTQPEKPEPKPRKRGKGSGGGDSYRARNLAADYLKLCHDPMKDLPRWLREDKKKAGGLGRRFQATIGKGEDYAEGATHIIKAWAVAAKAYGLRRQPLQAMRGRLDADGERRRGADRLLARQRARPGRYDELRSIRAERTGLVSRGPGDERALSLKGLRAALQAFYGAKIEATRHSVPARDRAAAVRAIIDDRAVALRVLAQMRAASAAAFKERRQIVRQAASDAARREKSRQESITSRTSPMA
jgi:hypothetical protein